MLISSNILKNDQNFYKINTVIIHNFNYDKFILVSKNNNFDFYKPPKYRNCGFFPDICVYQDGDYSVSSNLNYLVFNKKW